MAPIRKVLACATVMEEMLPLIPPEMDYEVLDFGLHVNPGSLKAALQASINESSATADEIILGYGFCSMAVMGLRANDCTLVVPHVDDCISIFLGSSDEYKKQIKTEPGTYYLTKGWIEVGDTPFSEFDRLAEKYGAAKAERLIRLSIKHYKRLALIDTGRGDLARYQEITRNLAQHWDLRYEEIPGSNALIRKMLFGPWDKDFIVIPPGGSILYSDFFTAPPAPTPHQE